MELKSKELFISTLNGVLDVRHECGLEQDKTESLKDALQNMPLLVPVVGEFSAGKSSLLNALMGKNVLAVAINPETAIPAELYYSENEYDEGVRQEGSEPERIADLSDAAGKYVCVKRHISSPFLRDIEPVVLVDMPGFDSPLDANNQAVFNYLERGIHYAVIIPADAGALSKSMERQIQNILSFSKTCSFFLSRTDLRSEEEVEQVKEELQCEISALTGDDVSIAQVSRDDVSLFDSFVRSLNVDDLYSRQFRESVLDECFDTKYSLNTSIAALKADAEKNRDTVSALEVAIARLEEKKNKLIERAGKETFSDEADIVAAAVGRSLHEGLDALVDAAKSGGKPALEKEINSIVQNVAASNAQSVMEQISARFGKELCLEIKDLDSQLPGQGEDGISDRILRSAQSIFDPNRTEVGSYIRRRRGRSGASFRYKAMTELLTVSNTILSPLVGIFVMLIPDILKMLFGPSQEKVQETQLREGIVSQIPSIKRQVRDKVVELLRENSRSTITEMCAKFDEELQKKKQEIEKAQSTADAADVAEQIEKYSSGLKRIDELLVEVME